MDELQRQGCDVALAMSMRYAEVGETESVVECKGLLTSELVLTKFINSSFPPGAGPIVLRNAFTFCCSLETLLLNSHSVSPEELR